MKKTTSPYEFAPGTIVGGAKPASRVERLGRFLMILAAWVGLCLGFALALGLVDAVALMARLGAF